MHALTVLDFGLDYIWQFTPIAWTAASDNSLTKLQALQKDLTQYYQDKDKFMSNEIQFKLLFLRSDRKQSEKIGQYLKRKVSHL